MTTLKSEKLVAANKANAEAMLALTRKTVDSIERLANLNFSTFRESLQESAKGSSALAGVKDPKQLLAVQTALTEPTLENVRSYYHNLYELMLNMQKDITNVMESHYKSLSEEAENAIEETKAQLPAGGDIFATAMRSVLQSNSEAFERMNFMAQQIAQITDSNIQTFSHIGGKTAPTAKTATGSATKKAASKA